MDKILKYYRERINCNQNEVAKYLGVTPQRYFVIENTDSVPDKYIDKLCELFKVRKEILFKSLAAKNKFIAPEEVTYYRQKKGLSKQQLAVELDTYHTYVYSWESGKFSPNEKNAELLMSYLEIPDYIIFPDIVECDPEHIIMELEDYVLIVAKDPLKYNINISFKKVIYAYLFSDCFYSIKQLEPGERPTYPLQLYTNDSETFMFEFENQILIVTSYTLTEQQMNAAKLNSEKNIIYGVSDKMLLLILTLIKEKKNGYFFCNDFISELKSIFSSVTLHEPEHKIICSTSDYLSAVSYEKINDEVIFIKDIDISFIN